MFNLVFVTDLEGDEVLISSDSELAEAIAECLGNENTKLFKIFVKVIGDKDKPKTSQEGKISHYF